MVIGALLIPSLPLVWPVKALFFALWVCRSLIELQRLLRGMSRVDRICLDPRGGCRATRGGGPSQPLELLNGSLVLPRIAWLRLRFADGVEYGELLTGNRQNDQWRRLQLLWRQRAAPFGGPQVS